mgnify:CR=1 FL=1
MQIFPRGILYMFIILFGGLLLRVYVGDVVLSNVAHPIVNDLNVYAIAVIK